LVQSVKLEPTEFPITRIESNRFFVNGLMLPEGIKNLAYEVVRPLNIKVGGKDVFMKLELGVGQEGPVQAEGGTSFSYSKLIDVPKRGDLLRIANMPKKGQVIISECLETYKAPGSIDAEFKLPFVKHASYKAPNYKVRLSDSDFYKDTNLLLQAGFFKHRVASSAPGEICLRAGYLLKVESSECPSETCRVQMLSAITLIKEKGGVRLSNSVHAEKIQIDGFSRDQLDNFVINRAFESTLSSSRSLTEKFSISK
jgi:hypothetical protein